MLDFKRNFFFFKFSVLFFIIMLFGFWNIDLNSEELYIAFSFFFLVILVFLLVRGSVSYFFTKLVNTQYERLSRDLVLGVGAVFVCRRITSSVRVYFKHLRSTLKLFTSSIRRHSLYRNFFFALGELTLLLHISAFNFLSVISFSARAWHSYRVGVLFTRCGTLFGIQL